MKFKLILATLALPILFNACGEFKGNTGATGPTGPKGDAGPSGTTPEPVTLTVSVDRSLTPWSDNNFSEIAATGFVELKNSFSVPELAQNENGGWIDFIVYDSQNNAVSHFCYQGQIGSKSYNFSYKKVDNAVQGCDSNSEKDTGIVSMVVGLEKGGKFQIIPRAPRFNGIPVQKFNFFYLGVK